VESPPSGGSTTAPALASSAVDRGWSMHFGDIRHIVAGSGAGADAAGAGAGAGVGVGVDADADADADAAGSGAVAVAVAVADLQDASAQACRIHFAGERRFARCIRMPGSHFHSERNWNNHRLGGSYS
jgi:hypothetical protein